MKSFLPLSHWLPNIEHGPVIIAGPCSAESEQQVLKAAQQLKQLTPTQLFRAGVWKPRTRPSSFEGVGEQALPWLQKAGQETGLKTATEVANARHVEAALKHGIDVLWIGARTTGNPFSVQEIADALRGVDIPVMLKNPINADLALWIGGLERLSNVGIKQLAAIHRGFSSFEKTLYRNQPMWKIPMELKRELPELPVICDPSHIAGDRSLIYRVAQKAMDLGFEGLMIESHPTPDQALSDAKQQVTPLQLSRILNALELRSLQTENQSFAQELQALRSQIDRLDADLMEALAERMRVVSQIGACKIRHNVTALQVKRMDEIIQRQMQLAEGMGLRPEYIEDIYRTIHEASIKRQTDMMQEVHQANEEAC